MEITHMGCGREAVRINPDGSMWIVPDITPVEAQRVLHDVALTAAGLLKGNLAFFEEREIAKKTIAALAAERDMVSEASDILAKVVSEQKNIIDNHRAALEKARIALRTKPASEETALVFIDEALRGRTEP